MTDTIHSCSYYCQIPACIKAQRDELREKLYQRTWVGLTEKEICNIGSEVHDLLTCNDGEWGIVFYQVIESKLKEKNGIAPQGSDK